MTETTQAADVNPSLLWDELADQLEAFARAWDSSPAPPEPADFLTATDPAARRLLLIELIKLDLEYRWSAGREPRYVEQYLESFPELADDTPVDLLYEEFFQRRQAGQRVTADEYARRFPAQAAELRGLRDIGPQDTCSLFARGGPQQLEQWQPGTRLDDFDLLMPLGRGAFASVFLARQVSMQRLVALKISSDQGTEPQTLAQLDHPSIVRVFDQRVDAERQVRLLYMEYVRGGTLEKVVERVREVPWSQRTGRLLRETLDAQLAARGESPPEGSALRQWLETATWPEAVCRLGAQLARALDYAHNQGVLHRDIKPANVLLTEEGLPKLADFNISFSAQVSGATPAAYFGGSLAYMSPEQLEACHAKMPRTAADLDARSDLYVLAAVLWELLVGYWPFPNEVADGDWTRLLDGMLQRRQAGLEEALLRQLSEDWPPGLREVLTRCLTYSADERIASGAELARELELCLHPQTGRLLQSPSTSRFARWATRFPICCVLLVSLIPNLLAAVFNLVYNRQEIVALLDDAEPVFWNVQAVINAIAFPLGLVLVARKAHPISKAVRQQVLHSERAAEVRRRCLQLGHWAAGISLILWLLAGLAYPVAVHWGVGSMPLSAYLHFVASLTLCGLIAAAYPFFLVTWLMIRGPYATLLRRAPCESAELGDLGGVSRSQWAYLAMAVAVPMLGTLLLLMVGADSRFVLLIVSATGLVGSLLLFVLARRLQADLEALTYAIDPRRGQF